MSKPANGTYSLVSVPPGFQMTLIVDDTGATSGHLGRFNWVSGVFRHVTLNLVIICTGEGTFDAVLIDSEGNDTQWTGTCTKVA